MKKIHFLLLSFITIFIIVTPFFVNNKSFESLSLAASLLGAFASVVTLVVALMLYSKYGLEKSLFDKQVDLVLKLLGEIKKTRLLVFVGPKAKNGMVQIFLHRLNNDEYWRSYKDKRLLFSFNYFKGLEKVWEISDNILLPKEIAKRIKPLEVASIKNIDDLSEEDLILNIPGLYSPEEDGFGQLNGKRVTLNSHLIIWESLIVSIKNWLKEHAVNNLDLNFEDSLPDEI